MPVITVGASMAEMEKRLGSALLAGQQLITLDNIGSVLESDMLCQIIDQPTPQVRILGKSKMPIVNTRSSCFFADGNNLTIGGDLWRRVVRARLDPKVEQPELREFKHNPIAMVMADRGAYIAAALTIPRAYIVADRPNLATPKLASFEGWSDTIRSALLWLGEADPVKSMATSRVDDPGTIALREMLAAWGAVMGIGYPHRATLKAVVARATETKPVQRAGSQYPVDMLTYPELNAAVRAAIGDRDIDVQPLGYWMRANKDRLVDGKRFKQKPDPKGSSEWWVAAKDNRE
jgi:putative DNA primase/helicase